MTIGRTRRPTRATAKRKTPSFEDQLELVAGLLSGDPKATRNFALMKQYFGLLAQACGNEETANVVLLKHWWDLRRECETLGKQKKKLMEFVEALRAQKPAFAWIVSPIFEVNGGRRVRRFVHALPLGACSGAPQCFEVVDVPEDNGEKRKKPMEPPPPPFVGLVDHTAKVFLGPVAGMPAPPLQAQMLEVVASYPTTRHGLVAEVEVSDGVTNRNMTLFAQRELASDIKKKLEEDGESVTVRAESGVATAIHKSDDKEHEDWLEFPPLEGPRTADLIFPGWLRDEWERDIRSIAMGRPVRVALVGPTGTGKSSAVERAGRDASLLAARMGNKKQGYALIRVSSSHVGSSFIHQTERTLLRVFKRARSLARKGWIVVMLWDEADALLGEMNGFESTHNRTERLAAQELLSEDIEGVAVYMTMNPRKNSWLPSAIGRRFRQRCYPRCKRGQLAAVASYYIGQRPQVLDALGLAAGEFAGAFADNLFSDQRVVAIGHMHSGKKVMIRARDLRSCSPGKARDMINTLSYDVEDGVADSLEHLWKMIDMEFKAPNLNRSNLFDVTFLQPRSDDSVRTVELVS